jgi:hypothetical protein
MDIARESMDKLVRVKGQLKSDRARYDSRWQEIARYINPAYGNWDDSHPGGTGTDPFDYKDIFDNTALKASSLLADGIQGYAFSRDGSWFRLSLEDEKLMKVGEYAEWLQSVERSFYKQFSRSNIYDEGRAFVKCGADFGTAVMFRTEDTIRGMPSYKTLHLKDCLIKENRFGEVDTLFRDLWLTPDDAMSYFGSDALPKSIVDAADGNPTKQFKFTQYVGPRGQYSLEVAGTQPFVSVYYADIEQSKPVSVGEYRSKPFFVWRWSRNMNGEVWGSDCPGMVELPNVKQANSMRKNFNRLVQLTSQPPLKATEGLRGRINMTPNGVTYVRPGEDFAPTQIIGNLQGVAEDMALLRQSTNETYHTDFFLILTQNIERTKTATEVAGLQGEKAALLSAFFGRLAAEFLEPLLEDLFALELASGRLVQPPATLADADLKIDLVSPLASLQKRVHELSATDEAIARIVQVAQIDPTVIDTVDFDQYVRTVAESYNMKQTILRDELDVERIRKARLQQQMEMQQQQMGMQEASVKADVALKGAKAMEAAQGVQGVQGA